MMKVVQIRSHVRGAGGAMRKLTERDLDAQIAANRERADDAFERYEGQPSVIPLDNSLRARFVRLVQWFRLKGTAL